MQAFTLLVARQLLYRFSADACCIILQVSSSASHLYDKLECELLQLKYQGCCCRCMLLLNLQQLQCKIIAKMQFAIVVAVSDTQFTWRAVDTESLASNQGS